MWFAVDDSFMSHPKVAQAIAQAGPAVVALWLEAGTWSARYLTDGKLTAAQVAALRLYRQELAAALVAARLWDAQEDGGVQIHDFLRYNPPAARVLAKRAASAAAAKRARSKKAAQAVGSSQRPAGPSDYQPPGKLCGVEFCDGYYHFGEDPSLKRHPKTRPCPQGPRR